MTHLFYRHGRLFSVCLVLRLLIWHQKIVFSLPCSKTLNLTPNFIFQQSALLDHLLSEVADCFHCLTLSIWHQILLQFQQFLALFTLACFRLHFYNCRFDTKYFWNWWRILPLSLSTYTIYIIPYCFQPAFLVTVHLTPNYRWISAVGKPAGC